MSQADDFVDLFNLVYPHRQATPEYYQWQFGHDRGNIVFAYDGDTLKGCGGYRLNQMNGFLAALIIDVITHPNYSDGQTFVYLSKKIERCAKAHGAKVLYMLPNAKGAWAFGADKEWKRLGEMLTYTYFPRELKSWPSGIWPYEIHKASRFYAADVLAAKFNAAYPRLAMVKRDESYLNWRVSNPMHDYSIFQSCRNGIFCGYIILKTFLKTFIDPGGKIGDIVDIVWDRSSPDALINMLRFALGYFRKQGASEVVAWLETNTVLDAIGRWIGFRPTDPKRDFLVKVLDKDYAWLTDINRWYLTMSDSEIY